MKRRTRMVYVGSILLAAVVAGLGGWVTDRGLPAYALLDKPVFTPPAVVFPIVWSILYLLMAVSAGIVFLSDAPGRRPALAVYAVQLAVNLLWSFIFFGFQRYFLGFLWILLLILLVSLMIVLFSRVSRPAGLLQLPYLAWLIFAAILNFSVYAQNAA